MGATVWIWGDALTGRGLQLPQAWREGSPAGGDAVIVWGGRPLPTEVRGNVYGPLLILNAHASQFRTLNVEETERKLRRAGVPVCRRQVGVAGLNAVERSWRADRTYSVSVFHLRAIDAVCRQAAGLVQETFIPVDPGSRMNGRLTRLAVKALYALGLDNGIVELIADDAGRLSVADVRLPGTKELQAEKWGKAIASFRSGWREIAVRGGYSRRDAILIGADPEFVILSEAGKVVSAARFLNAGSDAGCDAVVVGGTVVYPVAELRPEPARSPEALAANMRKLLREAAARISDKRLRWKAGGMPVNGFALGGHIHISGVPLTGRLLRQLDSYCALPLALIESPGELRRRPRYGALGDFRLQPHGGFEYRTPPSWLVSPAAAKAALALALLCARESDSLPYVPAADERYVEAYYAGDKETLRSCLEPLAACMAQTRSYRELAVHIEPLLEAARQGRVWDPDEDLRMKWRVPPYG